jgi:hypothetical protein
MYLTNDIIESAVSAMGPRSHMHLGSGDYFLGDATRVARNRWRPMTQPGATGFALAAFYVPNVFDYCCDCSGGTSGDPLNVSLHRNWLEHIVLLPVHWDSLVDPYTGTLSATFAKNCMGLPSDPMTAQALMRFPHVGITPVGSYVDPLGMSTQLSLTPYESMHVWHLSPCSEDEAMMWAWAYVSAEHSGSELPSLAYNWGCSSGGDLVDDLLDEATWEGFREDARMDGLVISCGEKDEAYYVLGHNDDERYELCGCCGYWPLKEWLLRNAFPSVEKYLELVKNSIGHERYTSAMNEAREWLNTGLAVAHDMTHMIQHEGGELWGSWWHSQVWPEPSCGGPNALPIAHRRFQRFAS